jgi:hypothetical protein
LSPTASIAPEEALSTLELRLPIRRRRLRGVVIAAVSACVLILVAAGVARVGHASSEPARELRAHVVAAPTTAYTVATSPSASPTAPSPSFAPSSTAPQTGFITIPAAGTLRLERNLTPRWVWLDGKKLGSRTQVVACGPHQIKVGRAATRAIDVPCGGELRVSR